MRRLFATLAALGVGLGCQCGPGSSVIVTEPRLDAGLDGGSGAGPDGGTDAGSRDAGVPDSGPVDAGECLAPDVLIALDRTLTMHRTAAGATPADTDAGHASSKWAMAINGIEQFTAAPLDGTIRFGLELWPRQSPGCITLGQRIRGDGATNPSCEGPEVPLSPSLSNGAAIASLLDPETTLICTSTPTGEALIGAQRHLEARRVAGREQFVALVTDGADWDFSCPAPNPLNAVDGLADAGISTLVIGFSAEAEVRNGVGTAFLNDLACAGRTAKNFPAPCVADAQGRLRARVPDAGGADALFYTATNTAELVDTLRVFARTVCCGCIM